VRAPTEPPSQVVFIHDYIQLVFQDEGFNVYNVATLSSASGSYRTGGPGFADALVALIGEKVVDVAEPLSLQFSSGASLTVSFEPTDVRGPEAFEFHGRDGLMLVEQNAV
jgi:hypothetical protein